MVTIETLLKEATKSIQKEDAAAIACGLFGCDRGGLILKMKEEVDADTAAKFTSCIEKAKSGMPVAYILGRKEFYSLDFIVTPDVLIPRPDTEILVENIIPLAGGKRVLDICCGSGCIGISIAKNADCALAMIDISEKALEITEKNCALNEVSAQLFKKDILNENIDGECDIIVSNPPYIESDVVLTLEKNVRDFEPHLALDGGGDGLCFYPVIAKKAFNSLVKGGTLAFEIGYNQGKAVYDILVNCGFENVKIIKDYAGNDRVVSGIK